ATMSRVFCFACLLLSGLVAFATGNGFCTQYRGNAQHPFLHDHCLYEELDLAVPLYGEVLPTGYKDYCVRVKCEETYLLVIRHCDHIAYPPMGCNFGVGNYDLPYPECCPQVECS
ncbi:hypothetical protein KR018_006225, partial [Drosophila ironensis]